MRAQHCEWRFDDGQYISTCEPEKFINMSPAGMTYCPYCGRPVIDVLESIDSARTQDEHNFIVGD